MEDSGEEEEARANKVTAEESEESSDDDGQANFANQCVGEEGEEDNEKDHACSAMASSMATLKILWFRLSGLCHTNFVKLAQTPGPPVTCSVRLKPRG